MKIQLFKNKLIKIFIAGAIGIIVSKSAMSQQEPLFTQYMFNTLAVNPAYTGTTNSLNILALTRYQWVGMEGAPETYTVSIHSPLQKRKIGLGLTVMSDNYGPVRNTYISANYAYRLSLTEKITLSMGIKAGIYNYYIGLTKLDLASGSDDAFQEDKEKSFNPNFGAGLYMYTSKWYVGFAIPKFIQSDLNEDNQSINTVSELKRHYFFMAGYVFEINHDWAFKPSFIEKVVTGAPISTDITAQFLYKNRFWLGASYRVGDAIAFLFQTKINDQLMVGYSYDWTLSNLSGYNSGSHEIMISIDFDKLQPGNVKSPRYF